MDSRDNTKSSRGWGLKSNPIFYVLALAIVFLVGSVILNVALAEKLRSVNNKLSEMDTEARAEIGTTIPNLEAKNLDGIDTTFSFSMTHRPTFFIFSRRPLDGVQKTKIT